MKQLKNHIFMVILTLLGQTLPLNGSNMPFESAKYSVLRDTLLSNETKDQETLQIDSSNQQSAGFWGRVSELIIGKKQKTPDLNIKTLNNYEKLDLALNNTLPIRDDYCVVDEHVMKELSLTTGAGSNKQEHLVNSINRCSTIFGYITLAQEISNPTDSIELLEKKQELCKQFLNYDKAREKIIQNLVDIKKGEDSLLRLYEKKNIFHHKVKDYSIEKYLASNPVLKPFGKELDTNPTILANWKRASILNKLSGTLNFPFVGQVTGIAFLIGRAQWLSSTKIIGNLKAIQALKTSLNNSGVSNSFSKIIDFNAHWENFWESDRNTKIKLGMLAAILAIPYGTIYKVQLDNIFGGINFDNQLVNKVKIEIQNISALIKALKNINCFIQNPKNKLYFSHITGVDNLNNICTNPELVSDKLAQLLEIILEGKEITDGQALASYYLLDEVKKQIMPALEVIGQIDVAIATAVLIKEFENKNVKFSFVKFVKSNKPYLKIKNGWTPLVNPDFVVATDFEINGPRNIKNIMLTGPGGCGKSTSMKELCNNIIMAQTLGIAPAESIELAPYSKICTAIGVEEDLSRNKSKFMAQQERMNNIEKIIDETAATTKLDGENDKLVFIAVDECYNGTTEILGAKLLYNFALKASRAEHTTSIISTHFRVGAEVPNFSNFQVELLEPSWGKFKRTFKLLDGVCDWWLHDADKAARFARWLHGMEPASSNNGI